MHMSGFRHKITSYPRPHGLGPGYKARHIKENVLNREFMTPVKVVTVSNIMEAKI